MQLMPVEHSLELRATDGLDVLGHHGGGDGGGGAPAGPNPLMRLHMLLKGRYLLAAGLGAVLALGGAAAGYKSGKQLWQSTGTIRVQPVVPKVLYDDPEKGMLPMFDSFVDLQVALMRSQRLLDVAMTSEPWKAVHPVAKPGTEAFDELLDQLSITRPRSGSQLIFVTVMDEDPKVAQGSTQAIIEAYKKLYLESDAEGGQKKLDVIQEVLASRKTDYNALKTRVVASANDLGASDRQYELKAELVAKYEAKLQDLELALATVGGGAGVGPATAPAKAASTRPAAPAEEITAEMVAQRDKRMASLLDERYARERHIRELQATGRVLEGHPLLQAPRAALKVIDADIEERLEHFRKLAAAGIALESGASASDVAATPEQLRAQRDKVKELYAAAKAELRELSEKRMQLEALRQEAEEAKRKVDEVQTKIDQMQVESQITGRIKVESTGDRPMMAKDTRLRLAGMGGMGGFGLGVGIVLLFGLADRRFRSPDEARMSMNNSPMLGVLPNLPDDLSDPEQAAVTAHFVHQIRTLLQIWDSGRGKQVFSITSPVAGTGKTSLCLALGVSFAAASKTLLIDCDLIGGGLSSRANAMVRRKIGRVLRKEGLLTEQQLEEALRLASGSRRRLGEILVELGYLKEEELSQALVTQQKGNVGVLDALAGEPLEDCIAETGVPNLHVLPLGGASAQHISKLTPQAVRRLLDRCREQFDTILIDSGPTPGSLEASAVAAEVDGVILCVSRGEQRPLAEKCVQHLLSLGARVAGVVFNRARTEDMAVYSTTIRASQPVPNAPGDNGTSARESARFGPMARAVASSAVGQGSNGENGHGGDGGEEGATASSSSSS